MSKWDEQIAEEAYQEAQILLATEMPDADLTILPGAPEAFDAGVWFGITATLDVLARHGYIKLVADGESRE